MNAHRPHPTISARFSAAANSYTEASALQDRVARRILELIPADFVPSAVIDAGCGPGRILALARERWSAARMTGIDIAPGMIQAARARFARDPLITLIEADLMHIASSRNFDVLVSGSALHWISPMTSALQKAAGLVRSGGLAAIAVMLDGTLAELHAARVAVAPDKPARGRLPNDAEFETAARSVAGSRVRRLEFTTAQYDLPSAADVLRSVHDMGVTGGEVSRSEIPLNRRELAALTAWYDQAFATSRGVRVTFRVGYLLLEVD